MKEDMMIEHMINHIRRWTDGQWKRNGWANDAGKRKILILDRSVNDLRVMPFLLVFPSFPLPPSFLSSELSMAFKNQT
jgi:hypothetical protein